MVVILQFPGTNCERDVEYAYGKIIGVETAIIWYKDNALPKETKLVVIPGGFSYGDYLRSGAIARLAPIMKDVIRYAQNGGLVLGICNGFQILSESRLLPGALKRNENLLFISNNQKLKVQNNDNRFLSAYQIGEVISLPIAHADGNYYVDSRTLETLEANNQILFRYMNNPNGSVGAIAGVCNAQKNVFGLMPHPERSIELSIGGVDGLLMLETLIKES